MFVLLNQDKPPLVIDHPEDDLDNHVIKELVFCTERETYRAVCVRSSRSVISSISRGSSLVR